MCTESSAISTTFERVSEKNNKNVVLIAFNLNPFMNREFSECAIVNFKAIEHEITQSSTLYQLVTFVFICFIC